jgi:hypothetical protein
VAVEPVELDMAQPELVAKAEAATRRTAVVGVLELTPDRAGLEYRATVRQRTVAVPEATW